MSVSVLSLTSPLGSISGLLQVAALLGLVLLLLKAAQLYLHRQWLLKAFQQFPSPPAHWLFGHNKEVKRSGTGEWEGRGCWGSQITGMVSKSIGQSLVVCRARGPGTKPSSRFLSQSGSSLPHSKPVLVFLVHRTLLP